MARQPRFNLPGYMQHVIVRGNNREPVFHGDGDYSYYLQVLRDAMVSSPCELHAYVLMTNHMHLLMTPLQADSLSKVMQSVGRVYVQQFNRLYNRTGTLWEGRYRATLVDSERYALACYRYIEMNPVRAKMVEHPADYPWSSYRCNALGDDNTLLSPHPVYRSLGDYSVARQAAYRELFDTEVPLKTITKIRDMTNKSWALGGDDFKREVQAQIERELSPRVRGGDRKSKKYRQDQRANTMNEINRV